MKIIPFLTLIFLSNFSYAADWELLAEATSCGEKIQIMGKEGEKYIIAVRGSDKIKLHSNDGSIFKENSPTMTEYTGKNGLDSYRFFQPSYVEANPPKLDITTAGKKHRCSMEFAD